MVDVQIAPAATGNLRDVAQPSNMVCVNETHIYVFYLSTDFILVYRESLDGGGTWSAETTIYDGTASSIAIKKFALWFDQWTVGLNGPLIHCALIGRGGAISNQFYWNLDTDTNVLTGPVSFVAGGVQSNSGWNQSCISITRSRSGKVFIAGWQDNAPADRWLLRSNDVGLTWTAAGALAFPVEAVNKIILLPGNEAVLDDLWMIDHNVGTFEVNLQLYDSVADSWSSSLIVTLTSNTNTYFQMAAATRFSDGHVLLAMWTEFSAGTADLLVYEINTAVSFTARTDALTNFPNSFQACIQVDQATDNIRVGYFNGTPETSVTAFFVLSDDGALTWGPRTAYSVTADDHRWLAMAPMQGRAGGRFIMAWRNDDLDDILTNADNAVDLGPIPQPAPPPVPPPDIVPPGGTYLAAPGAPPGTILYITPDGIQYPLVTPHVTGRFVMSMSGFGTAPIQYISQRGPNQDGETVRDFNLTPRVIQILERQQFKSRGTWWDGRADILNDLRPNRQATATAVVTGTFRIVTANGDVRDLNVFIQDGPRFEARNVDEWDEWAFEEVLRFIAHDPLWFNPTRVDLDLAFALDANLVFPITFPIQFGNGLIDVSINLDYTGTWASLPTIVITGPIDNPRIDNVTTGEKIELSSVIGPGRTVTIDLAFGQKTITDDLGNNLLGSLTTDSDLGTFHIAPTPEAPQVVGQPRPTARNVIRLRGSNPTGATSVEMRYFTRYFGI